ncbi:succinate dehydrogenase assembly factor 2 [Cohaesibacter celericrescens]|uniref:FAD assembly factor SdhE n=1 Tax=Cohaesibacter celericrescens TaxID=2067669 RepID=A0A2N5XT55_9HYPH|nr:succinate dehydrogenase assembly factor 2 [Cohaesibacter celericrescens]PLW77637.1 succinate dehydrogenase assembly factor 2 [Cohaesibacter celericrescens]
MSHGSTRSSEGLDVRRKKILMRAWHRGIKEMDLMFGRFVDDKLDVLTDQELSELEMLMDQHDRDLLQWFTNELPVPEAFDCGVFHTVKNYHKNFESGLL